MQNTQALRVVDSFYRDFVKGNCCGSKIAHDEVDEVDEEHALRRRKRKKSGL